jgi:hypothetical protein
MGSGRSGLEDDFSIEAPPVSWRPEAKQASLRLTPQHKTPSSMAATRFNLNTQYLASLPDLGVVGGKPDKNQPRWG